MAKKPRTTKPMAVPQKKTTERTNWFAQHPIRTALGIYFLLAMIFFFDTVFGGRTYVSPDAQTHAAVTAPLDKEFWETWTLPQWSPYTFCGIPSFASLMYAPFVYMPGMILLPLARLVALPAMLTPALHYVLAAMGVFVFLRRKGASFWPALLGGLAFMFTPWLVTMQIFGHGSQMMTSAYIPWALWAVDRLMEKFSWRRLGVAGLILGFQFQRGHVQISYYILLFVGLYVLCHAISALIKKDFNRLAPMLGGFTGALALAAALAAILYLPLQEYTPYSIRGTPSVLQANASTGVEDTGVGFEYATQWSFSPGEMMTFIMPSFYGFGGQPYYWGNMPFTDYPNYMGILVLALAITGFVVNLTAGGQNRLVIIFSGIALLISLLISFGHHFAAFYKLFYNYFPYFNKFRVPVMILILVQCTVAILAGLGLEGILSRVRSADTKESATANDKIGQKLWMALGATVFIVLALTIFQDGFYNFMRGLYPDQYDPNTQETVDKGRFAMLFQDLWFVSIFAAAGMAMLALALKKRISATTAAVVICLITLVDLWLVDKKIGQTYPQQETPDYLQPDAISAFFKSDTSLYRFYPAGQLFGELRWSAQGFQSVGGYHAAKPRYYQDFIEATGLQRDTENNFPGHHILDMLNAKYVLTFATLPVEEWEIQQQFQVGESQVLSIYENPTVLPRAYLVGECEVQTEPVAALMRLRAGPEQGFDPHRRVMLTEKPEIMPQPDSSAGAQILRYDYHHIVIATKSASPQMLVLSDNYYPPGWKAYIKKKDDKEETEAKIYRANYCFRAISVPAGEHQVEFRFHSRAFTRGLWISLIALAVGITLLFVERRKPAVSP